MYASKFLKILIVSILFLSLSFFIHNKFEQKNNIKVTTDAVNDLNYSSNIMKDVRYSSKDSSGNEFTINALQAEIDLSNQNILYLTNINAVIILDNSDEITISSDYGKYNSENFDTIFSKNVIVNYLENKITSEYLDFSLNNNQMIISKNVVYSNLENIMSADVVEMNIETKDTKIFMHETNKKVNIKNK